MKKKLFVVLVVTLALGLLSIQAFAGPPEDASGDWYYIPSAEPVIVKVAGGNAFMTIADTGSWTGTIVGDEVDTGRVIIHRNGAWQYWGDVLFASATVNGKTGGLEMKVFGQRPDATAEWIGTWRITAVTGELEGLHGHGTWDGPGWSPAEPGVHGVVSYSGNVNFRPN
ncbi:MAG TPA: hypothetical protein VFI27_22925 [candidate division Zixibacteria bacterium]|nr:hypothetical protein [candidate division Zixibacteria bacterium]